jgi:tetratricopeptide (TPR) repeat protein
MALAYGKWGQVLATGGHATGALIVWQSALARCEKLARVDAANVQAKEDEADAWERLASFYAALGTADRALAAARSAVDRWTAIGDGSAKTKAGRRRLALAMLRCGDINVEVRQFPAAAKWYAQAADEVAPFAADPLLGPVAKLVAEQQAYLSAVKAGLVNAADAADAPAAVRVRALRTVAAIEVRADHPTAAAAAAAQLARVATTAEDRFAAAAAYAGCAAAARGTEDAKADYAAKAVEHLKRAVDAGFRDANALAAPEWEAVRKRVKEFAAVRDGLETLRDGK